MIEFEYLLAAVRKFFRPEFELPSTENLNWAKLAQLADQHAVTPFLHLAAPHADHRHESLQVTLFNLTLSAELRKHLMAFESRQIRVVPLKGPVLNSALYGGQTLRTSADLDLLVHPDDVLSAKTTMEQTGYRMESVLHWPVETACFHSRESELSFSDPTDRVSVDLHWRLFPEYFPAPFKESDVWRDLRLVPWESTQVWTLSPEHQFLFLCAHGAKHLWLRLGWICDIARLIEVEPDIDWDAVYRQSAVAGSSWTVSLALLLAAELLGVPIPPPTSQRVASDPAARSLAATITKWLYSDASPSVIGTARFYLRAFRRPSHRLRLLYGVFIQPTEAEYCDLQLPPPLFWLYFLFRPMRLTWKHGSRLFGC